MDRRDRNGKRPWTSEEDEKLRRYVREHGPRDWKTVARELGKSGNSCRLRWYNYLAPEIVRGNITDEEMILILKLHYELGNKWSKIAQLFPGRTDNEIKNFWNTTVKKEAKLLDLDVNSKEFRERMTEILTARIQMASVPVDIPVPPPTTTAALPPPAAGEGGSGGNFSTGPTVGYPDGADFCSYEYWPAQQLGNHGFMGGDHYADHAQLISAPFPALAVPGGSTVGYPKLEGANLYSYEPRSAQKWGSHDSVWSNHADLSTLLPPPTVAVVSGGNTASTGHTAGQTHTGTAEDPSDNSWSNYLDFPLGDGELI